MMGDFYRSMSRMNMVYIDIAAPILDDATRDRGDPPLTHGPGALYLSPDLILADGKHKRGNIVDQKKR